MIGAHNIEHGTGPSDAVPPDWESVRIFLAVARSTSFRTAATHLNMTGQGVAKRVEQLEQRLGNKLFTRHRDGVRLTAEGCNVLSCAKQMEEASLGFVRRKGKSAQPLRGEVRIAATEGLGTFWVTPRLIEFVRAHPQILVDLHCSMQRPDELVARAQADFAIQLERPTGRDLVVRRLGRMHIVPCASEDYIKTYGAPRSRDEISERHRILLQYADQGKGRELYEEKFPGRPQAGFVAMRTDASTALYAAIVNGVAIGWVPTYYFAIGTPLVPLDIDWRYSFDIWLSYHPDLGEVPRIRRMIDWAIGIFDPITCPWFREDYVTPAALTEFIRNGKLPAIDAVFSHAQNNSRTNSFSR